MVLDDELRGLIDGDGGHCRERPRRDRRTMLRRLWDAEHLSVLSTKVTTDEARRFRRLCASVGETPYAVIKRWVQDALGGKRGV